MNYEHARDAMTTLSDTLLRVVDELEQLASDLGVERSRIRDLQREVDELKAQDNRRQNLNPPNPPSFGAGGGSGGYPPPWPCPIEPQECHAFIDEPPHRIICGLPKGHDGPHADFGPPRPDGKPSSMLPVAWSE